jgi:hypothetical protein
MVDFGSESVKTLKTLQDGRIIHNRNRQRRGDKLPQLSN